MLDLNFVRENLDAVRAALLKRGATAGGALLGARPKGSRELTSPPGQAGTQDRAASKLSVDFADDNQAGAGSVS